MVTIVVEIMADSGSNQADESTVIDGIEKEESDTLLGITMSGLGDPVMHVSWEKIKTGHFVHR